MIRIKTQADLTKHFKEHDDERERLMKSMMDTKYDDMLGKEYDELRIQYDKSDISYGEFDIASHVVVMYWGHEGDVLRNVRFCPFCGVEFEVVQ